MIIFLTESAKITLHCFDRISKSQRFFYMMLMSIIFFDRCAISENDTYAIQGPAHQRLVNLSVPPADTPLTYSQCDLYSYHSDNESDPVHSSFVRKCSRWVYDQTDFLSTFVTEVVQGIFVLLLHELHVMVNGQCFAEYANITFFKSS